MAMTLPRFDFAAPASVAQACELLAEAGAEARLLAGGTDLLVKMKRGVLRPRLVVSLGRLPGLGNVEATPAGGARLGACATMSRLASSEALTGPLAALAQGAGSVGGPIVRNRATVGGNLVTARPCADTAPPLISLGATLRLESRAGSRSIELDGFIAAPGATAIRPDELLAFVEVPEPVSKAAGSCYLKLTRRSAMEVTIVGCAASIALDEACEKVVRARVVLASVAPTPVRVRGAERALEGEAPTREALRAAAGAARSEAQPIDDHRASRAFRAQVVEVLARRALETALAGARGGSGSGRRAP
jgi:carbon-monoxide dehydrogenase medium subunit